MSVAVGLVLAASACGGGGAPPLSREGDLPPTIDALPQAVDVCTLVPANIASNTLDTELRVVGLEYGPPQVPTLRCLLGTAFATPELSVELATGPIAANVFEDAYGDPAGGDPVFLKRVGDGAFLRSERDLRTVHVYTGGSVLTLRLRADPTEEVRRAALVELADLAVDRLPRNPRLAPTRPPRACANVDSDAVAAAIGAPPSLSAGLADEAGSLQCSWASRPGSATVVVLRDPAQVEAYRRAMDPAEHTEVRGFPQRPGLEVWSRTDRAGDLVMVDGDGAMATVTVVPSAGFADGAVATTPGERELGQQVLDLL